MNLLKLLSGQSPTVETSLENNIIAYFYNKIVLTPDYIHVFRIEDISFAVYKQMITGGFTVSGDTATTFEYDADTQEFKQQTDSDGLYEYIIDGTTKSTVTIGDTVLEIPCILYADLSSAGYINTTETETLNTVTEYIASNKIQRYSAVTLELAQQFRTLLASWILTAYDGQTMPTGLKEAMTFYAADKSDDTYRTLQDVMQYSGKRVETSKGCGCTDSTSSVTVSTGCDFDNAYIEGMHNIMVTYFRSATFWRALPKSLIQNVLIYIDAIIKYDLPIFYDIDEWGDCTVCDVQYNKMKGITDLKNIQATFNLIFTDDTSRARYMNDNLYLFAETYYELMEW